MDAASLGLAIRNFKNRTPTNEITKLSLTAKSDHSVKMLLSLSKSWTSVLLAISEWMLLLFGIMLVAGLLGEYFADHKKKEYPALKRRKRLFEQLVIIGVAGELFADGGIFSFGHRLQTLNDFEVAQLNEKAQSLNKEAAVARLEAATLEKQIDETKKNVANLNPRNRANNICDRFCHVLCNRQKRGAVFDGNAGTRQDNWKIGIYS